MLVHLQDKHQYELKSLYIGQYWTTKGFEHIKIFFLSHKVEIEIANCLSVLMKNMLLLFVWMALDSIICYVWTCIFLQIGQMPVATIWLGSTIKKKATGLQYILFFCIIWLSSSLANNSCILSYHSSQVGNLLSSPGDCWMNSSSHCWKSSYTGLEDSLICWKLPFSVAITGNIRNIVYLIRDALYKRK